VLAIVRYAMTVVPGAVLRGNPLRSQHPKAFKPLLGALGILHLFFAFVYIHIQPELILDTRFDEALGFMPTGGTCRSDAIIAASDSHRMRVCSQPPTSYRIFPAVAKGPHSSCE